MLLETSRLRPPLPSNLRETHAKGPGRDWNLEKGPRYRAPACSEGHSRPRAVLRCPGAAVRDSLCWKPGPWCTPCRSVRISRAVCSSACTTFRISCGHSAPSAEAPPRPLPRPRPSRPPRHLSDVLVLAERSLQRREHLAHRHCAAASRPRGLPRRRRKAASRTA